MRVPANRVSNAFRLLGSGELSMPLGPVFFPFGSQMPFGFWVLGNASQENTTDANGVVSNAFRLLGSGEPRSAANFIFSYCVSNAFRLLGSGERGSTPHGCTPPLI